MCGCGVRELAKPIEAVCEVADEEACAKRMRMQMMKGLVMVRIFDDGSEQEAWNFWPLKKYLLTFLCF